MNSGIVFAEIFLVQCTSHSAGNNPEIVAEWMRVIKMRKRGSTTIATNNINSHHIPFWTDRFEIYVLSFSRTKKFSMQHFPSALRRRAKGNHQTRRVFAPHNGLNRWNPWRCHPLLAMVTANVHDPFADSFGLELRGEGVVMTWCGEPQEKRTRKMNVFLWIFGYPETSRFLLAGATP